VTVDKLFPPPDKHRDFFEQASPYPLMQYPSDQNLWDRLHRYKQRAAGPPKKAK
jgi:hypothetical protein